MSDDSQLLFRCVLQFAFLSRYLFFQIKHTTTGKTLIVLSCVHPAMGRAAGGGFSLVRTGSFQVTYKSEGFYETFLSKKGF